ncbi:MAG: helix-turn-helix domain-containing protein [Lachnospiraceae bacterium]|nr:helix-turn-helix domain-containing protein [Lachnospiraceae bacterium]
MNISDKLKKLDATDERQYLINENYEVYEKQGAPTGATNLHSHNFYEVIYVLSGEYSAMIADRIYRAKKGDFLLINRGVMHKYEDIIPLADASTRIILWITPGYLAEMSGQHMDLSACFRKKESCAYHFPVYYEEMLQNYLLKLAMTEVVGFPKEGVKEVADRGYLTLFFVYLNLLCDRQEYRHLGENYQSDPLIQGVSDYIDGHISEKILVEDLAKAMHMSKYHFLRTFKEVSGETAHGYIINKKLMKACELLKEGASVTESYEKVGFADYTSFLRNFRRVYGISPGKYNQYYRGQ